MGQCLQAQYISCGRVGSQVGDDLGVIDVTGHDFQAFQQPFSIQCIFHPQSVDDAL